MSAQGRDRVTVAKIARGLVVSLIHWEMGSADGESMAVACDRFGAERVQAALRAIVDDLERKGVAYLTDSDIDTSEAWRC